MPVPPKLFIAAPRCPNCGVKVNPYEFSFWWGVWHFGPVHRLTQRLMGAVRQFKRGQNARKEQ